MFCPAGMQQFKSLYKNSNYQGTIANIQGCFRLNDIDEIGDGSHSLRFDMMGLFSFRQLSVEQTIHFWFQFLQRIGINPSCVTIHPDKMREWSKFYDQYNVDILPDPNCTWSDGEQGGYCTEFYVGDLEIGNIVNTSGDCIDVGFGLDRLLLCLGETPFSEQEVLKRGIISIIDSGFQPGNKQQGYVLRRLLRKLYKNGWSIDHCYFEQEIQRQKRLEKNYHRLLPKNPNRSREWWLNTHGIDPDDMI